LPGDLLADSLVEVPSHVEDVGGADSYVDDDATSVFVCKGQCDYRITFGLTLRR